MSKPYLPAARISHFFNTGTGKKAPSYRGYHWGQNSRPLDIRPSANFTANFAPTMQKLYLDISKTAAYELARLKSAVERGRMANYTAVNNTYAVARMMCV